MENGQKRLIWTVLSTPREGDRRHRARRRDAQGDGPVFGKHGDRFRRVGCRPDGEEPFRVVGVAVQNAQRFGNDREGGVEVRLVKGLDGMQMEELPSSTSARVGPVNGWNTGEKICVVLGYCHDKFQYKW